MSLWIGPDRQPRCGWCGGAPEFLAYHDQEWGFPVADERWLFEKLCLESFQAGLSWRTILAKRDNFRAAFAGFDIQRMAGFDEGDVARLLQDAGIVRHRGKIEAVLHNARLALRMREAEGSLGALVWRYAPAAQAPGGDHLPASTAASERLSRELKRLGWRFVGPTTVYAFMQAAGLVNDHLAGCALRPAAAQARAAFTPPVR